MVNGDVFRYQITQGSYDNVKIPDLIEGVILSKGISEAKVTLKEWYKERYEDELDVDNIEIWNWLEDTSRNEKFSYVIECYRK